MNILVGQPDNSPYADGCPAKPNIGLI